MRNTLEIPASSGATADQVLLAQNIFYVARHALSAFGSSRTDYHVSDAGVVPAHTLFYEITPTEEKPSRRMAIAATSYPIEENLRSPDEGLGFFPNLTGRDNILPRRFGVIAIQNIGRRGTAARLAVNNLFEIPAGLHQPIKWVDCRPTISRPDNPELPDEYLTAYYTKLHSKPRDTYRLCLDRTVEVLYQTVGGKLGAMDTGKA